MNQYLFNIFNNAQFWIKINVIRDEYHGRNKNACLVIFSTNAQFWIKIVDFRLIKLDE